MGMFHVVELHSYSCIIPTPGKAATKSIMNLKIGNALEISNINTLYIAEYRVYYRTAPCAGLGGRSKWMRAVATVAAFQTSVTEKSQGVLRGR